VPKSRRTEAKLAAPIDDVAADLRDRTDVLVPGHYFSRTGE
jgi:hypothetical protein